MSNGWRDRWVHRARSLTGGPEATSAGSDLAELIARIDSSFLGRCVHRFISMAGIDRSVVLSSQAFTALIPILILVTAWAPTGEQDLVADAVIKRFALSGDAADAVNQLFAAPTSATSTLSTFSILLLIVSGTSFTRRMAKMYRAAWDQEKMGVRGGLYAALGLFVLLAEILVLYLSQALVARLPLSWLLALPISIITGTLLWTSIPYLLLNRDVHWRRLFAGGVLSAVATAVYSIATTIYMPSLVERYTNAFGLFGISTAMIGWLLAVAFILVASAAIGAEFDASQGTWVLFLKDRFHLEDPDVERPARLPHQREPGLSADDFRLLVRVVVSWVLLAGAVWIATLIVPGIDVPGGLSAYLLVSLVLGLVNAVLGTMPSLLLLPSPVVIVGGMALVTNAVLLILTALLSSGLEIDSFASAMMASAVIAAASTVLELVWSPIRHRL